MGEKSGIRTVTLLDLRMGLVELSEDQRRLLRKAFVPVLVDVVDRLLREDGVELGEGEERG